MAKKSTTKKAAAKKTTVKASKSKAATTKKASVKKTTKVVKVLSKAKSASAVKKTAKEKVEKKPKVEKKKMKIEKPKKSVKIKAKEKKVEKKGSMSKKKLKTEEAAASAEPVLSAAEIRARALAKIKGYSKEDLEHFREIILSKRDEIVEQLQNLKEQMLDPTTGEYINENSPYSLHMAEQGTDAMEREKTFLYAQRENKFLGYLEEALNRIDAGTYGICIDCIEEPHHLCDTCPLIPKARLEAVPHSQLCLPMKQKQEKR